MTTTLAEMEVALRMLKAITERREPDPQDVKTVRQLLPHAEELSDDERACKVIQQALIRRSRVRAAAKG